MSAILINVFATLLFVQPPSQSTPAQANATATTTIDVARLHGHNHKRLVDALVNEGVKTPEALQAIADDKQFLSMRAYDLSQVPYLWNEAATAEKFRHDYAVARLSKKPVPTSNETEKTNWQAGWPTSDQSLGKVRSQAAATNSAQQVVLAWRRDAVHDWRYQTDSAASIAMLNKQLDAVDLDFVCLATDRAMMTAQGTEGETTEKRKAWSTRSVLDQLANKDEIRQRIAGVRVGAYLDGDLWPNPTTRAHYYESAVQPLLDGIDPGTELSVQVSMEDLSAAAIAAQYYYVCNKSLKVLDNPLAWVQGDCTRGRDATMQFTRDAFAVSPILEAGIATLNRFTSR